MTPIDLEAKSDRELLIMAVGLLNTIQETVDKHEKWINGQNGKPGAKFQIWVMWALFVAMIAKII